MDNFEYEMIMAALIDTGLPEDEAERMIEDFEAGY